MGQVVAVVVGVAKVVAGFIAKSAILKTIAINLAIAVTTSAIQKALTPKAKNNGLQLLDPAQYNRVFSDTLSPRTIGYGYVGIAGEIVFQQVHADKQWISIAIQFLDGGQVNPHEFTALLIDGESVTFDVDGEAISPGKYAGRMRLEFKGGSPTQTGSSYLTTNSAGLWTSAHKGKGCVWAVWSLKLVDDATYPAGIPDPMFVIKARRVYDPRLDDTFPGGSGDHRIDDESTWEWSDNAALCAFDWARGINMNGKPLGGLHMPIDLIDLDWIVASANACDDHEWTVNGPVSLDTDPADITAGFAQHMGGRAVQRRGKLALIAADTWPSVTTLTESDLAGALKIHAMRSWREAHNEFVGAFRDPANEYEAVETNPFSIEDWVMEDGGQVLRRPAIAFPYADSLIQATRLLKIEAYRARAPRVIEAPWKLRAGQVHVGDFVDVELPSYDIDETYEVTGRSLNVMGFVSLTLTLYDPTDAIEFAEGEEGDAPVFDKIDRGDNIPSDPSGWSATGITFSSGSGSLPAVEIVGEIDAGSDAVLIEYSLDGGATYQIAGEIAP